jgi:4-hydroxythreonine-4-phosphate dehydrogenase
VEKPIVAITMGDPAGIGPEIVVKTLSDRSVWDICRPLIVGDPGVMRDICPVAGGTLKFRSIESPEEAQFIPAIVDVLCPPGLHVPEVRFGQVDAAMGKAAVLCLEHSFRLAMARQVQGVVSTPLNKEAFHLAGYDYLDELELLAEQTGSAETMMVGILDAAWTVAVTEHVSFRAIPDLITARAVLARISTMHELLENAGFHNPRIAVAALNVHAGEGGLFGQEEIDEIGPAVQSAREMGIRADGPFPADTLFLRAMDEGYKGIVCMYHDQVNIARKLLAKRKGVTLFTGLPVVCCTTPHGTAFDIAGKGISDPSCLEDAMRRTALLAGK